MNLSPETGLCLFHDPERREKARSVASAGGKAKGEKVRRDKASKDPNIPPAPRSLKDAERMASWLTYAVLTGDVDARTAESATKSLRQFQLTVEKRALEDQLKALTRELAAYRRKEAGR